MTINPIHTNASSLDLTQSLGSRNVQSQNSGLSSTQTSDEISIQNPDMAKAFQFMEQMQQLQTSDPDKFKSVMSELSGKLKTAAGNSTDSTEKQFLTTLSDGFAESAKSGKLEMPKPPEGAGQAGIYGTCAQRPDERQRCVQSVPVGFRSAEPAGKTDGPDYPGHQVVESVFHRRNVAEGRHHGEPPRLARERPCNQ
jgi:uncharacterized protein YjbJ (UPF0337 family)